MKIGFIGTEEKKRDKPLTEEEVVRLRQTIEDARKELYIPEHRMEQMLSAYDTIVVHDFDDSYHLSDEQRASQNKFYLTFGRLNRCKRRYRRLPEYVECARLSLECLNLVATENNTVYGVDKFKHLVLRGKLNVYGWFFPEYRGKDRKQIDMTYLGEFIESDQDPAELVRNTGEVESNFMSTEELQALTNRLFSPNELDKFFDMTDDQLIEEMMKPNDGSENPSDSPFTTVAMIADKGHIKELMKVSPAVALRIKDIQRRSRSRDIISGYVSDMHLSDLEFLEKFDSEHGIVSNTDIPTFHGDFTNSDDYHRYLRELKEWEDNHIKVEYAGRMRTRAEIRDIELRELFDDAGWAVKKLYGNDKVAKELERARKADRKREKKLHKQLLQVKERSQRRLDKHGLFDSASAPKKGKKGAKKSKKKKKEHD